MSKIEIRTISAKQGLKQFIEFHTSLYKDDKYAVPYLFMSERDTLDPKKNPAFDFCQAECYMAYRDGKPVGRIAAIINNRANERWDTKAVRFGFFDFIDDKEVSKALIDKVKEYGKSHGMDNIIGPMGFTDMDREGMLVSGFDYLASMHANHNYEYYPRHMEAMGEFEKDNDWVMLSMPVPDAIPPKMLKVGTMIEKRYNLHARKLTRRQLLKEGYGKRLFDILNECYGHLYGFSKLDEKQVNDLVNNYISLADLNLITIVTDDNKGGEMVGFGISFPSFSEALQKTKDGKLLPFGWFHLLKALKFHKTSTVDLLLVGVLPEYRTKGANALIFCDLIRWYQKYGFKTALALPMMETNNGVLDQWSYFDAHEVKRLRSYKAML